MSKLKRLTQINEFNRPIGSFFINGGRRCGHYGLPPNGLPDASSSSFLLLGVFTHAVGRLCDKWLTRRKGWACRSYQKIVLFPLVAMRKRSAYSLVILSNFWSFYLGTFQPIYKTILLSFVGLGLALLYPLWNRYTICHSFFLELAFSWAIPLWHTVQQSGDLADPKNYGCCS